MLDNSHVVVDDEDAQAVAEALAGRDFDGGSPYVEDYEQALCAFFGTRYAVACSSGTTAITIALNALGVEGEVLLPATAPIMTPLAVLDAGATPVFVDVEPDHPFHPSRESVEERMTPATQAIMTVPMWGYPGREPEISALAKAHGLHHLEDAAQAHGATLGDRLVGTIGTVGTFSTHSRKLMTTGEGGFCVTSTRDLDGLLRSYRAFGRGAQGFGSVPGHNAKLAGVLAALGIVQLRRLGQRIDARRRVWGAWKEALADLPWLEVLLPPAGAQVNGYALVARAQTPLLREQAEDVLQDCGIVSDPRRYSYAPPYRCSALAAFASPCLQAQRVCSTVFTVPSHEGVPGNLIAEVAQRLRLL